MSCMIEYRLASCMMNAWTHLHKRTYTHAVTNALVYIICSRVLTHTHLHSYVQHTHTYKNTLTHIRSHKHVNPKRARTKHIYAIYIPI